MSTPFLIIILIIIYLLFVYIFELLKEYSLIKLVSSVLGFFIFYALLYNVTYNSDWNVYDAIFMGQANSNDFLFSYISKIFSNKGYDFSTVYKFHIFLIGVGIFYFVSRNSYSSVFGIITTYLIFQIVPVSNQIRYYLAYFFFLIASYSLIVTRNRILFFIFITLSILTHLAMALMLPFFYFYYYTQDKIYIKRLILFSIILAGLFYLIYLLGFVFSFNYGSYFEESLLSTFAGGMLNNFIWLIWLFFIYKVNKKIEKNNINIRNVDVKYNYFYKISLYCILFFPSSIILQILAHRYIASSLLVWLTYFFYSLKYLQLYKERFLSLSLLISLILLTFVYIYILPVYLFGISTTESVSELFLFNEFLFKYYE